MFRSRRLQKSGYESSREGVKKPVDLAECPCLVSLRSKEVLTRIIDGAVKHAIVDLQQLQQKQRPVSDDHIQKKRKTDEIEEGEVLRRKKKEKESMKKAKKR